MFNQNPGFVSAAKEKKRCQIERLKDSGDFAWQVGDDGRCREAHDAQRRGSISTVTLNIQYQILNSEANTFWSKQVKREPAADELKMTNG